MESPPGVHDRPAPDGKDVRKATAADTSALVQTLAEAFYDDPHFIWMFPDETVREARIKPTFALFVRRVWLPLDDSFIHEKGIGCALWMPPGTAHISILRQLAMLPAMARTMRGNLPRVLKLTNMMDKKHPEDDDHYYLPVIGVRDAWQGRGFGGALLAPMLARCDSEKAPAYLEATTPRNRALYERNGFELVEECRCADDAPPLWRMWREPAS